MTDVSPYEPLAMYIGGRWLPEGSGGTLDVVNPATERLLARLPLATSSELAAAVQSAERGQYRWRRTSPGERGAIIVKAAALIRQRIDSIATTMTLEQGKPLVESRLEVLRAAELMEWAAEEGRRVYGLTIPAPPGSRYATFQEPIGVIAALTPWNFPAVAPARKVGSALAAGCACILKPSELTPGTAMAMVRAFVDAGLPPDVLNLVFGDPSLVSSSLIASPVVRKISFTGSVSVGKSLAQQAGQFMKPALMELGGHAPTLIFDDSDILRVARASVIAKFRNAGQVCTSPTRFFVQSSVYDEFVAAFVAAAGNLILGNGLESSTQMGPLASRRRVEAIDRLVTRSVEHGAQLLQGGERTGDIGCFYRPTVLGEVPHDAPVMREEPFGPVAAFQRFETVEGALREANRLPYGLAAYAFTNSIRTAREIADGLECGIVGINSFSGSNAETPFGGVKDSGYGREGGIEGVRSYTTTKFVVEGSL